MSTASQATRDAGVRFAPRRIGHGNFFVTDVERSTKHYEEVFGLQVVFREPDIGAAFLSNGNSHHDVGLIEVPKQTLRGRDGQVQIPVDERRKPGLNHIGFEMESEAELVAAYDRALANGVAVHRTVDHTIARSVYLFDPDGYYLEFYADSQEDWQAVIEANKDALLTGNWSPDPTNASAEALYVQDPEYTGVEGAPLKPHRASRAALFVSDLQTSIDFYTDVVGLTRVAGSSAEGFAVMAGALGNWDLGLYQAEAEMQVPKMHHFSFEVSDSIELKLAAQRLSERDIEVVRMQDHAAKRSLYVHDPDGILFEFYYSLSNNAEDLVPPQEGRVLLI